MATANALMVVEPETERLFGEVTASCTGLIARIALSYEADQALRRELIQDIFLAIWLALPSFRSRASLKTFVVSIAHRRASSHVTRRAREPRHVELPEDLSSTALQPDEVALDKERKRQLARLIPRLPAPQRDAIVLCLEGFSYSQTGRVLGITTNAAMLRCQRAKATLQSIMELSR